MTVRAPGEECLTKTQETQRAFQKKLLEKDSAPSAAIGRDASKGDAVAETLLPQAVKPVETTDAATATENGQTDDRSVNVLT